MVGKVFVPLATFKSVETMLSREALFVGVTGILAPCFSDAIVEAPSVDVSAGNYRFRRVTRMLIEMIEEIDPRQGLSRSQIFGLPLEAAQAVFTVIN